MTQDTGQEAQPTTVERLQTALTNLQANRARVVEQMKIADLERGNNEDLIKQFDVLIANIRGTLCDSAQLARVEDLIVNPPQEPAALPLGVAGAGAETAPAPAGSDAAQGAVGG